MVYIDWLIDRTGTVVSSLNMKFCRILGVSFHPKEVLRNLKIQKSAKVCLQNASVEMLFCHKNQPSGLHLGCQYTLADRFLRNSGYLVECEVLLTFGCQFPSKTSFEKSENTEVCLNLTLKWQCSDAFLP